MTDIELDVEKLEAAIDEVLEQMSNVDCASDEYRKMTDQLVKLYKAKETHVNLKLKEVETQVKLTESSANILFKDEEAKAIQEMRDLDVTLKRKMIERPWMPSADSIALVAANLAGIVMILGHERANVIASKAIGFVSKLR